MSINGTAPCLPGGRGCLIPNAHDDATIAYCRANNITYEAVRRHVDTISKVRSSEWHKPMARPHKARNPDTFIGRTGLALKDSGGGGDVLPVRGADAPAPCTWAYAHGCPRACSCMSAHGRVQWACMQVLRNWLTKNATRVMDRLTKLAF